MKKCFLLTIIGIFYSILSIAQNNKFEIGFAAGPQLSGVYASSKTISNQNPSITYNVGLNIQYPISKKWFVRTELDFVQLGTSINWHKFDCNCDYAVDYKEPKKFVYKDNYFQIPVLIRYKTNGKVSIFFHTGPYWSILLSSKTITHYTDGSKSKSANKIEHASTLGWIYGTGIQMNVSARLYIPVELRYQQNLISDYRQGLWEEFKYGTIGFNTGLVYRL